MSYMFKEEDWRNKHETINSLILTGKTCNPSNVTSHLKNAINSMSSTRRSPFYEGTDVVIQEYNKSTIRNDQEKEHEFDDHLSFSPKNTMYD